jgi:hypothetical protein
VKSGEVEGFRAAAFTGKGCCGSVVVAVTCFLLWFAVRPFLALIRYSQLL